MRRYCSHYRNDLGCLQGEWLACAFHGFEYDAAGQCRYIPALGKNGIVPQVMRTPVYPVAEVQGMVFIWWGENPPNALNPPRLFDSIPAGMPYGSFQQPWTVHYSRMAENQLDMMHLPFVHYNTIGRGGRTVVDGPFVRLEDDLLELWLTNRLDDGTPARRQEDLPPPTRHASLQFRFPNLWHNWISDDNHIVVAFVPVDDENSIMYGRYYQNFVRLPLLRELANWFGVRASIVIANQDRRIVNNQMPKRSGLKIGERVTQADGGIVAYRRRREELLRAAGQE